MSTERNDCCEKKRILVVLAGGTICSKFEGVVKRNSDDTGLILEKRFNDSYSPFANNVEFRLTDSFGIFSENMTVAKWNMLIQYLRTSPEIHDTAKKLGGYPSLKNDGNQAVDPDNICDGIIIAHGTDSLAYSAALFSLLLKNIGVPVFLVSSNEALSADCANGTDNFTAAVECICMGIKPNVYVTYQNISDRKMYLHYGSRIKQCANYEADFFSTGMVDISDISPDNCISYFKKLPRPHIGLKYEDTGKKEIVIDFFGDWLLKNTILMIDPYVGLNYDFYNYDKIDVILHGTYHSGTVCSENQEKTDGEDGCFDYKNSIWHLIDVARDKKIYISPADVSGNIYETSDALMRGQNKNVFLVNGFTKEMLYAKLLVALSYDPLKTDMNRFLACEYNHEIVISLNGEPKLIYQDI